MSTCSCRPWICSLANLSFDDKVGNGNVAGLIIFNARPVSVRPLSNEGSAVWFKLPTFEASYSRLDLFKVSGGQHALIQLPLSV
jgi:hypothetical protein